DYPGAVKGGRVIAPSEYEEQRSLLGQARELQSQLHPTSGVRDAAERLGAELRRLADDLGARADEEQVAADWRAVHQRLSDDFGLVLAPLAPPSETRARTVYAAACASCHGADGRADTVQARTLKPPPVSFFDGERMARISPSLAFHALTFGVGGT